MLWTGYERGRSAEYKRNFRWRFQASRIAAARAVNGGLSSGPIGIGAKVKLTPGVGRNSFLKASRDFADWRAYTLRVLDEPVLSRNCMFSISVAPKRERNATKNYGAGWALKHSNNRSQRPRAAAQWVTTPHFACSGAFL